MPMGFIALKSGNEKEIELDENFVEEIIDKQNKIKFSVFHQIDPWSPTLFLSKDITLVIEDLGELDSYSAVDLKNFLQKHRGEISSVTIFPIYEGSLKIDRLH